MIASDASIQPKDLSAAVAASATRYVAFDVFDTLLARSVAPEHVKMLASNRLCRHLGCDALDWKALYQARQDAEKQLCARSWDQHQELEFRFADLGGEILKRLDDPELTPFTNTPSRFQSALLACELAVERSVLKPVAEVVDALEFAHRAGKSLVLLTDFYLPAEHVESLLRSAGISVRLNAIFASSDRMASKRSGRLYEHVCHELRIEPSDLMMIGDNFEADYKNALSAGLRAVHLDTSERKAFYASRDASTVDCSLRERKLQDVLEHSTLPADQNMRALVPSLYCFIDSLYRVARRNGYRHLCFLAREGQALQAMFEIYQDSVGDAGTERIVTHYLLVSRRSCYAASLKRLEIETFDGLFRVYHHISLRDFLQSIGLSVEQISKIARELGIDADERIPAFRESSAYKQLLRSESFKRIFDEHRSTQRAHLNSYVRQIGIDLDAHPLVLIDVGWKGSIQDYLTSALPRDVAIIGYYLGLMNIGQPLENKHGLLFTDVPRRTIDYNIYTENRTIFEIVLCADHSSALRYEIDVAGKVQVVLDDDQEELQYIQSKIIPLRDDIIRAFRMFCLDRERFCLTANELRDFAARVHLPLVFRPWRSNVKAITEATHRENFGVFATSRFSPPGAPSLRERITFLVSLVRRPRSTLAASFWPAYTLSRYGTRMLARAYAYRRVRRWRRAVQSEVSALQGGRV